MKKKINMALGTVCVFIIVYFVINNLVFGENDNRVYIEALTYPEVIYDDAVIVDENNVVEYNAEISITESGTYIFEGDYEGVYININVNKDEDSEPVYIVLNNANLSNYSETLIYVTEAESVIINAPEDSVNYLSVNFDSAENLGGAAIYSKSDLVINGEGKIIIENNYSDGINGRDDVIIEKVSLDVSVEGDGIKANDYLAITNADIKVVSSEDGLKASNELDSNAGNILIESGTFEIYSKNDGISAEATLQINSGDFLIESGGGYNGTLKEITLGEGGYDQSSLIEVSSKSLKALNIIINGGSFDLSSYEDCIHSDYDLYITNGDFTIESGDDALHANNNLVIDDITLKVTNTYEGIEADNITINGGTIDVIAYDDAVNNSSSSGVLTINGGKIYLYSNGDGLDSNGDFMMTGGTIIIENDAIYTMGDYSIDVAGDIVVTGGSIVDEDGDDVSYEEVMSSGTNSMTLPSGRR